MRKLWGCRRTYLATLGILCIVSLGVITKDSNVGLHIAAIVSAVAASNAYQKKERPNQD